MFEHKPGRVAQEIVKGSETMILDAVFSVPPVSCFFGGLFHYLAPPPHPPAASKPSANKLKHLDPRSDSQQAGDRWNDISVSTERKKQKEELKGKNVFRHNEIIIKHTICRRGRCVFQMFY